MYEKEFVAFLKKKGKTQSTITSCVENAREFVEFIEGQGKSIEGAAVHDLESFTSERIDKKSVSRYMWALSYFFLFLGKNDLLKAAGKLRGERVKAKRHPFKLKDFKGVKPEHIAALAAINIRDVQKLLEVGKNKKSRAELAKKTGLNLEIIEELVKLSDLARIPGLKGIRARLYHDSGFDRLEKLRTTTPEEILRITQEFVEKTGFEGIAPLPKEAKSTIETAKKLPDLVEW